MSVHSPLVRSIDWRDPVVLGLGLLLVLNLSLLWSAIRNGALASVSTSLGVCYAIVVTMIGVSRGLTRHSGFTLALAGGLAVSTAVAFILSSSAYYAALTVGFGACSLYYGWRLETEAKPPW